MAMNVDRCSTDKIAAEVNWRSTFRVLLPAILLLFIWSAAYAVDFSSEAACPVCRIKFAAIVADDEAESAINFDGRVNGRKFLPLPECPMCGGVFADREFSDEELARIQTIIWAKEFQDLRTAAARVKFAFLLEKLEVPEIDIADAWLKASWAADGEDESSEFMKKSLGYFIQAYEDPDAYIPDRFATAVRIIDIHRRLGRFAEAESWIKKALSDKRTGSKGHKFVLRELLALIRAENSQPAEMPKGNFLHQAIKGNDYQKFAQHLKNRLLIDEENIDGLTPLILAIRSGDNRYVQALLAGGADLKKTDFTGQSPLHHAVMSGSVEMFEMLLRAGSDVNGRDSAGNSILHHLALLKDETVQSHVFKAALTKTADFNVRNFADKTPLHLAAEEGAESYVARLVEAGANINARLPDGSHVLFFCQPELIARLIELGADVSLKNNQGHTAFVQARLNADKARIQAFRATGLYGSPARKFEFNGQSWDIYTAIARSSQSVVADILAQDASQVGVHDDSLGETPLHKAVATENSAIAQTLIAAGANVNAVSDFLRTPLHYAAANGNLPLVKVLIEAGASVFSLDARGSTPLHAAAAAGNRRVYQLLVSHGASDSTLDNSGNSPNSLLNGR